MERNPLVLECQTEEEAEDTNMSAINTLGARGWGLLLEDQGTRGKVPFTQGQQRRPDAPY